MRKRAVPLVKDHFRLYDPWTEVTFVTCDIESRERGRSSPPGLADPRDRLHRLGDRFLPRAVLRLTGTPGERSLPPPVAGPGLVGPRRHGRVVHALHRHARLQRSRDGHPVRRPADRDQRSGPDPRHGCGPVPGDPVPGRRPAARRRGPAGTRDRLHALHRHGVDESARGPAPRPRSRGRLRRDRGVRGHRRAVGGASAEPLRRHRARVPVVGADHHRRALHRDERGVRHRSARGNGRPARRVEGARPVAPDDHRAVRPPADL